MNTEQLQNALKAAQETVNILTELIDRQESKPNPDPLRISVKVDNEEQYNAVREVLDKHGCFPDPVPRWSDWREKDAHANYHVICISNGEYGIYNHSGGNKETRYTFKGFMTKFAK
jgi:hypothetical protein